MMKLRVLCALLVFSMALPMCFSESLEDRFDRGMDMLFEGRYEDAESHFLTLGRELARSESPDARVWQAIALYRAGRIEHLYLDQPRRAVARLREALKLDPHAKFAYEARKEIAYIFYDRLRDYRTAALEFERLVHAFSDQDGIEEFQYRIAQCYFLLREFSQARIEARLLLEQFKEGPLAADAMLLVANSFYVEGRYQEAAAAYKTLLAIHPGEEIESRSRFELGTCYQELGQYKLAERHLLIALKQHPRPDMVRLQLKALQGRMSEEQGGGELPYATAGRQIPGPAAPAPVPKAPSPKATEPAAKEKEKPAPAKPPPPTASEAKKPAPAEAEEPGKPAAPKVKKPEKPATPKPSGESEKPE
jgi:tetratricopeptide (TPR) repeat protein